MHGQLSEDTVVEVPAAVLWKVYHGVELGKLAAQLLPDVFGRVEVLEGDGGVGTIVKVTYPPGTPGPGYVKEMFTNIDNEMRLKETEVIEGGPKAAGFDVYRIRLQILEKDAESSIIRTSVEYEIDDKLAEMASKSKVTVERLGTLAQVIAKHLKQNK
ncbi:hypothetical protein CCACVL1_18221 [Corchorus capsularis]|uniref:Bet v I/Major latex protein domain-containing protein n=1 Tax=Corchorus capsularis TaxID=210143 RepID=A0A1R3HMD3_COCAP|nr:hypothetical protein CCACVL1_18221 [Corchorus capsularis]